jgi:hypothetical protein
MDPAISSKRHPKDKGLLAGQPFNTYQSIFTTVVSDLKWYSMEDLNRWLWMRHCTQNLQYLGNQGSMRLLADKFNRTESTVCNVIDEFCKFIRCLDINTSIEKGVNIVVTCCVLQNICIQQGDVFFARCKSTALQCQ